MNHNNLARFLTMCKFKISTPVFARRQELNQDLAPQILGNLNVLTSRQRALRKPLPKFRSKSQNSVLRPFWGLAARLKFASVRVLRQSIEI